MVWRVPILKFCYWHDSISRALYSARSNRFWFPLFSSGISAKNVGEEVDNFSLNDAFTMLLVDFFVCVFFMSFVLLHSFFFVTLFSFWILCAVHLQGLIVKPKRRPMYKQMYVLFPRGSWKRRYFGQGMYCCCYRSSSDTVQYCIRSGRRKRLTRKQKPGDVKCAQSTKKISAVLWCRFMKIVLEVAECLGNLERLRTFYKARLVLGRFQLCWKLRWCSISFLHWETVLNRLCWHLNEGDFSFCVPFSIIPHVPVHIWFEQEKNIVLQHPLHLAKWGSWLVPCEDS